MFRLLLFTFLTKYSFSQNETTLFNGSTDEWFKESLKDIAYYLRSYKFNEYDRRYELHPEKAAKEYYIGFPRPPLRSLHWEVHKYCEPSLVQCVDYLRKRIKQTDLKRTDDSSVIVHDQQWDFYNHRNQIEIVDEECKRMFAHDYKLANPFEGPIERFQWRVTASYYMCWYTMSSNAFEHLDDICDNYANCLDPVLGAYNSDPRANDSQPFSCALYSFCPDPCCPIKHLTSLEKCWNSADNPCFNENPPGQRQCVFKRLLNTDFGDIIQNRWNVSCSCPQSGFEWNSLYGICVDVDECSTNVHNCDPEKEVCINLPGKFKCACKWGHTLDGNTGTCSASKALHLIKLMEKQKIHSDIDSGHQSTFDRIFNLFSRYNNGSRFTPTKLIIHFCALVIWIYHTLLLI